MKKIMVFIFALVIVLSAFALSQYDTIDMGYAKSTPKVVGTDCPDGHVCFWAVRKEAGENAGNRMCRANINNAWQWESDPPERCGVDNDKDPKPTKTNTLVPAIVIQPTSTLLPAITDKPGDDNVLPTATKQNNNILPTATNKNDSNNNGKQPTVTLTPTYVTGEDPRQVCDFCSLAETSSAAEATQASAQSTIAAGFSGGE